MYSADKMAKLVKEIRDIAVTTSRDNANVGNNFSAKLLQIASAANKTVVQFDLPEDQVEAYLTGLIHIHDLDSYNLTANCLHIDTGKALREGFNTGYGTINKPKRIDSAASLACIILQSSQNDMFGGQSHYDFDNDMADFVESTEQEIREEVKETLCKLDARCVAGDMLEDVVREKLEKSVKQAMQITVYNLNSMHSRAGSQIPFSSLNLGIPKNKYAALVCEHLLKEYNKGLGKGEQPIFPNIIFRVKDGVNRKPGDPYYYLFELACEVAGNRMNPTFLNLDSSFNKPAYDEGILAATMGCRTRILSNVNGVSTPKGRGNIAPVSMNLVQLAIETMIQAGENNTTDLDTIIEIYNGKLDDLLALCERQLLHRYDTLKKLKGKDLPFVVGENLMMGAEEVGPEDSIEPVLKQGTWSIGFIGLAEALKCIIGEHHAESEFAWEVGFNIVKRIREFCDMLTEKYHLNFTCYATPAEGLSGRFIAIDKAKYGVIPGVTDKDFYTNSYHVPVDYPISIIEKIEKEAPFHKLCNAGHISYIELDAAPVDDAKLIERIVVHSFTHTDAGYIGINFGIRYCKECGRNHIDGNKCPECGSTNLQGVHRVTGYLSLDERFGIGKKAEMEKRISHN